MSEAASPGCFTILATPASGDDLLSTRLNRHAEIVCHDQIFHHARPFFARGFTIETNDRSCRRRTPILWLDEVMAATQRTNSGARRIGFVLHLDQRLRVLEHLLFTSDMPLVLLDRSDRLAHFAESEARHRGRVCSPIGDASVEPLAFDLEAFKTFAEREEQLRAMIRTILAHRSQSHRLFELDRAQFSNRSPDLFEFLGVAVDDLFSDQSEQLEVPPTEYSFADENEVERALAGTVHARFIRHP